ncbi:MAG: dihydrofolate reductase [Clostridiales bacterium]|nr:dihydrofolate reductase [Clostridiales bacterium]
MFNKIVIIEPVYISESGLAELKKYCNALEVYDTAPQSEEQIIERIKDADCVLAALNTGISKNVLDNCPNIRFIQLCCSYYGPRYCKTDIEYAVSKGIKFASLTDYGDNGVIECAIASVINLQHGIGGKKWHRDAHDLTSLKVGVLGLGDVGKKVANAFRSFGAKVYYYSKTRKPQLESELTYLPLDELLSTVDVLTIHLNRDVCLIGGDKLEKFGNGKILINSSIGRCYELESLKKWLSGENNYYVCDKLSLNDDYNLLNYDNVIYVDHGCGVTVEALERASDQIVSYIKSNC